jgi:hypothetical protein
MLHGPNQIWAKPTEHPRGRSGATQDGQPGEAHAELPGEGNTRSQDPLLETASETQYTGQEAREASSEEVAAYAKNKEGVASESKDARSITSGDGWKIRKLN